MNEDDPEFLRHVEAKLNAQRTVIGISAELPAHVWAAMLAEESYSIMVERVTVMWMAVFSLTAVVMALDVVWWPIMLLYAVLGALFALRQWRFYRRRRARFKAITSFIERASEEDDDA